MEERQKITFVANQIDFEKKQKIEQQLLIAEAINFAYLGSQPSHKKGQIHPGVKNYEKWYKRKIKLLYPEEKENEPTIWQRLKRRSIKIN